MATIEIGAKALTFESLLDFVNNNPDVSLDSTVKHKCKARKSGPYSFDFAPATTTLPKNEEESVLMRTVLLCRLVQAIMGNGSMTLTVIETMAKLLATPNNCPVISLTSDVDACTDIAAAVCGKGLTVDGRDLASLEIEFCGLSKFEAASMMHSLPLSTVLAALTSTFATAVAQSIDIITGLSLDYAAINTDFLKNDYYDVSRPVNSISKSASNLQAMLRDSRLSNPQVKKSPNQTPLFTTTPQINAEAIEAAIALRGTARKELTATDAPKADLAPPLRPVADSALLGVCSAFYKLASASKARLETFGIPAPEVNFTQFPVNTIAMSAYNNTRAAATLLDTELNALCEKIITEDNELRAQKLMAVIKRNETLPEDKKISTDGVNNKRYVIVGAGSQKIIDHVKVSSLNFVPSPLVAASFCKTVEESLGASFEIKEPKGTRDLLPTQMAIRQKAIAIISDVFKRHGAVSIDTPVFELRSTLTGKYGEDSKLIYDLADQGGEQLSLRYDLTVPFARYCALHGVSQIKRYHIAKVYRRDQPAMTKGRFREFMQCDFDIMGFYEPMMPDAEVINVVVEILSKLQIGDFRVKFNNRKLLDAMLDIAGVDAANFRPICSAIDKLDKSPWEEVQDEMVLQKGLAIEKAQKIKEMLFYRPEITDNDQKVKALMTDEASPFIHHEGAMNALKEIQLLITYLKAFNVIEKTHFDLTLARGLDYYTGVVYEAVFTEGGSSIAGGGRYDKLVGMFAQNGQEYPSVGASIGIERIFGILEGKIASGEQLDGVLTNLREKETLVYVGSEIPAEADEAEYVESRMNILSKLWEENIPAEHFYAARKKVKALTKAGLADGVRFVVYQTDEDLKNNTVHIDELAVKKTETPVIAISEMVAFIQDRI